MGQRAGGDPDDDRLAAVGRRLREERQRQGISLSTLARQTFLSTSFLSLVENGKSDISMGRLARVMDVLGITLSGLDGTTKPLDGPAIVRANELETYFRGRGGVTSALLAPSLTRQYDVALLTYQPAASVDLAAYHLAQSGDSSFYYILTGELLIELDGNVPVILRTGDSISFLRSTFRRSVNLDPNITTVLHIYHPGTIHARGTAQPTADNGGGTTDQPPPD